MGEGLCLFSVSSTLLVKDKPLRGAYASLTSVVDTLLLKQAISPSLCIVDATNKKRPSGGRVHRTTGSYSPDGWPHFTGQVVLAKRNMHKSRKEASPGIEYGRF